MKFLFNLKPSIFFIIIVIAFFVIINNRLFYILSISTPFVFNLESKPITNISYFSEPNSNMLEDTNTTIGIYSNNIHKPELLEVFKVAGVPYRLVKNILELHKVKIIVLDLSMDYPIELSKEEVEFLKEFVSNGGTLIGNEILATKFGALKELFGYKGYTASKSHTKLILQKSKFFKYLDTPEEQEYKISTINISPYTNSIILGSATAIATYDDDTPAITINHYGKGKTINIGVSFYDLRYRNLLDKDFNANDSFVNGFEPMSDFIVMFIKGIYESTIPQSITLHTSWNNTQSAVIMTHDIESENNLHHIGKFISLEKKFDIKPTCFINVKYLSDNSVDAFFKPENFPYIQNLVKNNVDIGVLAQPIRENFFLLPYGTCTEEYPMYQQFGLSDLSHSKPTLCGELKVPKELLQGIGIKDIVSFRSSNLIYNKNLPTALKRLGYRYSSVFSSENILSYFPYRYVTNSYIPTESKIWEIPVTLSDSAILPIYINSSHYISLFKKLYNNGAVFNIQIKPDKLSLKPYFIEKFYNSLPKDVWKCSLKEFGDFWDKRDRIVFRYDIENSKLKLTLYSPTDIKNLTFKTSNCHIKEQYGVNTFKDKFSLDVKKGINRWVLDLDK